MPGGYERGETARLIRDYRQLMDAWETRRAAIDLATSRTDEEVERDSDQADEAWDAKERLRNHLDDTPILCDGVIYLRACGEIITMDPTEVVDVSDAKESHDNA